MGSGTTPNICSDLRNGEVCRAPACPRSLLAPFQGAIFFNPHPAVSAALRPPYTLWQPAGLSRQSGGMELVIKKERGRHEKMSKLQAAPLVRFYVLLSCSYSLFIGG